MNRAENPREHGGSPEGQQEGRFQAIEVIARAGQSIVWRGVDLVTSNDVAIKVYRPSSPEELMRIKRERDILPTLSYHRNIPDVYAVGEYTDDNGEERAFIVMELAEGSLTQRIGKGKKPLSVDEIYNMIHDVADAAGFAHKYGGILHRDIKPGNVLIKGGKCLLTDFGILKRLQGGEDIESTAVGMSVGTPSYISPEQVLGETLTPASDVYSLGIVLYETLTGQPPFVRNKKYRDDAELVVAQVDDTVPLSKMKILDDSSSDYEHATKATFLSIAIKAISKDPENRYQTMLELKQAINNAVEIMSKKYGIKPSYRPRHSAEDFSEFTYSSEIDPALRATTVIFPKVPVMPLRPATEPTSEKEDLERRIKKAGQLATAGFTFLTGVLLLLVASKALQERDVNPVPPPPPASPSTEAPQTPTALLTGTQTPTARPTSERTTLSSRPPSKDTSSTSIPSSPSNTPICVFPLIC